MLDSAEPYAPVPTFWSDQYDLHLQHVGMPALDDEVVLRGNPQDGAWCAFYRRDGRLAAALCVNKFREYSAARRLIEADAAVASAELADPSVDLRELARRLAPAERKREARR